MSLPRLRDGKANNPLPSIYASQRPLEQQRPEVEATATSSSSWRGNSNNTLVSHKRKVEESDEDLFTVPDVEARPLAGSTVTPNTSSTNP
ncbi:hypothetical protein GH714_008009 [Hevea brasiliensis]|uniref:Uncharacterized protein n=1 Tax=Hevea brasiliensis TaxID=3981 RepID=A0A6A6M9D9_HEVBR|nr:hypothetical protein GH714_008009 [Hevea brasiliensis]